jgi:hypothetical protein
MNWPSAVLALKTLVTFPVLVPQLPPPYTSGVHVYAVVEEKRQFRAHHRFKQTATARLRAFHLRRLLQRRDIDVEGGRRVLRDRAEGRDA